MKTSIFDMNFTLPPLVEAHEVEKEMPSGYGTYVNRKLGIGCS